MNRPLSFLHVTTFYPPYSFGGDAAYVYRLAGALAQAGHHVDVLHSIDAYHLAHPSDPETPWRGHHGVTVHGQVSGGYVPPTRVLANLVPNDNQFLAPNCPSSALETNCKGWRPRATKCSAGSRAQ